jgi:two-component system chemotaxis sensor kinase CheA
MSGNGHSEELESLQQVFRDEALELLDRLEACLLDIEQGESGHSLVEESFRHLHTLKGIAAMYGHDRLSAVSHALESYFNEARRAGTGVVPESTVQLALDSLDCMRSLASLGESGDNESACADADQLLEALAFPRTGTNLPEAAVPEEAACCASPAYRVRLRPSGNAFVRGLRPESIIAELSELGECEVVADVSAVPVLEHLDVDTLHITWELHLRTDVPRERVDEALMFLGANEFDVECADASADLTDAFTQTDGDEESHDRRHGGDRRLGDRRGGDRRQQHAGEDTVRVPANRLDQLVDMVGELVTAHGSLAALSAESAEVRLISTTEEIGRLVAGLRESVLDIRMVPIGTLFGRFRRHVRDLAADLGKDVEIVAEGAETEMDKGVLDRIAEPVLHILRNCLDHGLEAPEARRAAGKSSTGTIRLSAFQSGGMVHLDITDDGQGLDPVRIRQRALVAGLITPEAELDDEELASLLFRPGFSTAETVTEVSGRGVGLDVVKRTLDDLNGSISMTSVVGQGSRIRLSVPLTLAIIDGLLASVGDERYVVPLAVVETCAEVRQPDSWREHGRELLDVQGELVPLVRLREFFGIGGERPADEIAIVCMSDGKRFGIVVDAVQDTIQAVIKSFGRFVRRAEGLSGTTVLGDGSAVPVIDPSDLLHTAGAVQYDPGE